MWLRSSIGTLSYTISNIEYDGIGINETPQAIDYEGCIRCRCLARSFVAESVLSWLSQ